MCFSAESSFISAGLLGIIAYATVQKITSKKQYPMLAMLLFYVGMQLVEGFEWLAFERNFYPSFFIPLGSYYYLLVSFVVWPLGMPVSLYMVETDTKRRLQLKWLCVIAAALVLVAIIAKIINPQPPTAKIVNNSIQYSFYLWDVSISTPPLLNGPVLSGSIFVAIFFFSILFSSLKAKWIPCCLTIGTFLLTAYIYSYAFTSIWCFFASTVAGSVYILIERNPITTAEG